MHVAVRLNTLEHHTHSLEITVGHGIQTANLVIKRIREKKISDEKLKDCHRKRKIKLVRTAIATASSRT